MHPHPLQTRAGTLGAKESRTATVTRAGQKIMQIAVGTEDDTLTLLQPPGVLAAADPSDDSVRCLRTDHTFLRVKVMPDPAALARTRKRAAGTESAAAPLARAAGKRPRVVHGDSATHAPSTTTSVIPGARYVLKDDAMDMSEIPLTDLLAEIKLIMAELWEIYAGKLSSWRHEHYRKKGQTRSDLKLRVRFGTFNDRQQEVFLDELTKTFCKKSKYMNYVMDVLMPEAMTRVTSAILGITFDQAEVYLEKPSMVKPTVLNGPVAAATTCTAGKTVVESELELPESAGDGSRDGDGDATPKSSVGNDDDVILITDD
jgi:hypothetical protein